MRPYRRRLYYANKVGHNSRVNDNLHCIHPWVSLLVVSCIDCTQESRARRVWRIVNTWNGELASLVHATQATANKAASRTPRQTYTYISMVHVGARTKNFVENLVQSRNELDLSLYNGVLHLVVHPHGLHHLLYTPDVRVWTKENVLQLSLLLVDALDRQPLRSIPSVRVHFQEWLR